MQTFAKLDGNNIINIESLDELYCTNDEGVINETTAANHFNKTNVDPTIYKMATAARVNYPAIGGTYDGANDKFIDVQPYSTWVLDESTWQWNPPSGFPADSKQNGGSKVYVWNDSTSSFDEVVSTPEV